MRNHWGKLAALLAVLSLLIAGLSEGDRERPTPSPSPISTVTVTVEMGTLPPATNKPTIPPTNTVRASSTHTATATPTATSTVTPTRTSPPSTATPTRTPTATSTERGSTETPTPFSFPTPTEEVWTLTPTPDVELLLRVIAVPSLRLRSGPNTGSLTIAQFPTGAIVELTGEVASGEGFRWVQVKRRVDTNEDLCRPTCPWMAAGTLGGTVNYLSGLE